MGEEREIICDCGKKLREVTKVFDGIKAKVMSCPKCGFSTFTMKQAKEFLRLKELRKMTQKERKIIKIGNSKGITIPETLNIKVGEKAKIEILTPNSFKVVLKNSIL